MNIKKDTTEAKRLEKERIRKDIGLIQEIINRGITIEDEDIKLSISFKKIGETIVEVRKGIMILYGLSMSIKKSEDSIRDLLRTKGIILKKELFYPEFSNMIKITNQVNELMKILPQEFELPTANALDWKSLIGDHKKLVSLLQIYTEFNAVKDVDYKKSLSQYVGDNIVKYSRLMAKEAIDKSQFDQINRKISAVLHEIQQEYGNLYNNSYAALVEFNSLRMNNTKFVDVSHSIAKITDELLELKTNIAEQIEHVTKHLIAIQQNTELENDIKKNISECKSIIDKEMYTLKDRAQQK